MTLLAGAFEAYAEDPSRLAVVENHRVWTWHDFAEEVERIAGGMAPTDRGPVYIDSPSGSAFLGSFLAAAKTGRPACTLHQDWAEPELEAAIADTRDFDPDPGADEDDPVFYVGFTSGTSGRPKPFARRCKSWTSSFGPAGELFSVGAGDAVFLPGSLQHSHFLFGAVFALNRGASVRLFERFDPELLAKELREAVRGVLYLVPTMLLALDGLNAEPIGGVHSLVISGAKMEAHHWEIARRLFPRALIGELYGASELSFVTVNTEGECPTDPGYVGRAFPGVELEIRRPEGASHDEPGVVYVRSPYLFDGYVDGSSTDSPVDARGFMTVGDMGALAGPGLSLAGRASNLLITGGKNVHPEEVEARLSDHPDVAECVVVGVPHRHWGDELVGFLASAGDRPASVDSLRDHLRARVAPYKIPKRWFLVEEIPRTGAGKTDRSRDRLFARAVRMK